MNTETTQTLENQLVKLKNNIKFAQNFEIVCKAQKNKDYYSFTSLALNKIELFNEEIFSCFGLNLTMNGINFFEKMHEICLDKKIDNQIWINVIKSIKYILKNIDLYDNDLIAYKIADEIFKK